MTEQILDFTFRPKENRRRASLLFFTLMILSLIPLTLSVVLDKYKGLISLLAVILIIAALAIYIRYLVGDYAYVVMYAGSEPMLVITKTVGKRVSTLYNTPLSEIESIEKIRRDKSREEAEKSPETGLAKHDFRPSLSPDEYYVIKTKADLLKIEGTDELSARLLEYAKIARLSAYAEEDDE